MNDTASSSFSSLSFTPSTSAPSSLMRLPDEVLSCIFDFLSSFDLLCAMVHPGPNKEWAGVWKQRGMISAFEVDLERDLARRVAEQNKNKGEAKTATTASAATSSTGASASRTEHHSADGSVEHGSDPSASSSSSSTARPQHDDRVAHLINQFRPEYAQLIRLVHQIEPGQLHSLTLDNFGSILRDEMEDERPVTLRPRWKTLNFQEHLLDKHAGSLESVSLVASGVRNLSMGSEFTHLTSLTLSKCKLLTSPRIEVSSLTSLDVSRTLMNDLEVSRLLHALPNLRMLSLASCKNVRKFDGPHADEIEARRLFTKVCPNLAIIDLSYTGVIDWSVGVLTKWARNLKVLYLSDCFQLRAPKIESRSLTTLSLRNCTRLRQHIRVWTPNLKELDLTNTNIRDAWINAGGPGVGEQMGNGEGGAAARGANDPAPPPNEGCLHIPNIEVLLLDTCTELTTPNFHIEPDRVLEGDLVEGEEGGDASPPAAAASASSSSSPSSLREPPQFYPHLTHLDLHQCYSLTNMAFYHLISMSPNLTRLTMNSTKEVRPRWRDLEGEDRGDVLPNNLVHLKELYASACMFTDENLLSLFSSSSVSSLTTLHLRNCIRLTFTLPQGAGCPIRSHLLQELDVRATSLTDEALAMILGEDSPLPNLTKLVASHCEKLRAPTTLKHSKLQSLNLSFCRALIAVCIEAPVLREVDASANLSLNKIDLTQCPALRLVDVQHSHAATVQLAPSQELEAQHGHVQLIAPAGSALTAPGTATLGNPAVTVISKPLSTMTGAEPYRASARRSLPPSSAAASHAGGASALTPRRRATATSSSSRPSSRRASLATPPTSPPKKPATAPKSPPLPALAAASSSAGALPADLPTLSSFSASSSAASSSSPASSSSFVPAVPLAAPRRGIRSIDVCVSEERIRYLESKLSAEAKRMEELSQAAAAAPNGPEIHQLKSLKMSCYGLKKQLAIQKAKLKKEIKQLEEQRTMDREEEERLQAEGQVEESS